MGKSVSVEQAGRARAARFARDAYLLQPEDPQIRRLYMVATLEDAACETGLDKPLPTDKESPAGKAAAMGARRSRTPWPMPGARLLGSGRGHRADPRPTARGRAAPAPRGPALPAGPGHAISRPAGPLGRRRGVGDPAAGVVSGSSYVLEAMGFFASSRGAGGRSSPAGAASKPADRRVLGRHGLRDRLGATGRELVRLALLSPDYELALVDAGIDQPTVDILVQQLRRDGRTALVPLGIFARDDQFDRARRVAERTARAEAFYRPQDRRRPSGRCSGCWPWPGRTPSGRPTACDLPAWPSSGSTS